MSLSSSLLSFAVLVKPPPPLAAFFPLALVGALEICTMTPLGPLLLRHRQQCWLRETKEREAVWTERHVPNRVPIALSYPCSPG